MRSAAGGDGSRRSRFARVGQGRGPAGPSRSGAADGRTRRAGRGARRRPRRSPAPRSASAPTPPSPTRPRHAPTRPLRGHLRDPALLPDQRHTGLLRRRDAVQPARPGPLGAQLHLRHLLRRVGRRAPAGDHAQGQALRRVRERRGDQQLAAQERRDPRADAAGAGRAAAQGRDGVLRRRDRADLRRAGLRPDPAVGRAARAPRLQDRHDPARQRGRRAQRARTS